MDDGDGGAQPSPAQPKGDGLSPSSDSPKKPVLLLVLPRELLNRPVRLVFVDHQALPFL
jgi:hypothetical protein